MAARRLVLNGLTAEVGEVASRGVVAGDEGAGGSPDSLEFYHELELYRQLLALPPAAPAPATPAPRRRRAPSPPPPQTKCPEPAPPRRSRTPCARTHASTKSEQAPGSAQASPRANFAPRAATPAPRGHARPAQNSPVNLIDDQEYTFKNYYYPLSDADESLPCGQDERHKRKSNMTSNIDCFFEQPRSKKKKNTSSTVGQSCKTGGISYISTNREDSTSATHLIKIEIYDLKKLAKVPPSELWKQTDVRVKYYVDDQNKNNHFQQAKDLIYKITKEIAESEECKKYHFNS